MMPMYNNRKKVQPLSLNDLLRMRTDLERRLEEMRDRGVTDTGPLEDLYRRCDSTIARAKIDRNVSGVRAGAR